MSATKANKINSPTNNNPVVMDAGGDIKDGLTQIIDLIYPVGSIYAETTGTNPGTTFGVGTWSAYAAGRTLVGEGGSFSGTGGSADAIVVSHTHTASTAGAGGHSHTIPTIETDSTGTRYVYEGEGTSATTETTSSVANHTHTVTVNSTGSSGTNANMPPYVTTYFWQRTA